VKKSLTLGLAAVVFLLGVVVVACSQQPAMAPQETMDKMTYTDVTPAEAKKLIEDNPNLVIIDVSPYYDQGHLPGAVHYQLGQTLDNAVPMLDKDGMYLVYCHGDGPSMAGAQQLVDAGFKHVYRLEGNYGAWVDAGYEIEK
jgi:adenylyltransferase/sulfurtransferase